MSLSKRSMKSYANRKTNPPSKSTMNKPQLQVSGRRVLWRGALGLVGVIVIFALLGRWYQKQTVPFAAAFEMIARREQNITCSPDYKEDYTLYPACTPRRCGRVVMDSLISEKEVDILLSIAKTGLALGEPSGGAGILDLHSGALSHERNFINLFHRMARKNVKFSEEQLNVYSTIRRKIQQAVSEAFSVPASELLLTKPTFFSQLTARPPITPHDEYWHTHIDKEQYGSFAYTALLYLSTQGQQFGGGRFVFVDKTSNVTVEPRKGRVSFFTSGSENVHYVEPVTWGVRHAITVAFTCDPRESISDPKLDV